MTNIQKLQDLQEEILFNLGFIYKNFNDFKINTWSENKTDYTYHPKTDWKFDFDLSMRALFHTLKEEEYKFLENYFKTNSIENIEKDIKEWILLKLSKIDNLEYKLLNLYSYSCLQYYGDGKNMKWDRIPRDELFYLKSIRWDILKEALLNIELKRLENWKKNNKLFELYDFTRKNRNWSPVLVFDIGKGYIMFDSVKNDFNLVDKELQGNLVKNVASFKSFKLNKEEDTITLSWTNIFTKHPYKNRKLWMNCSTIVVNLKNKKIISHSIPTF